MATDRDILVRLDTAVNGAGTVNGEPGLVADVRELRKEVAELRAQRNTHHDRAWTVAIALVTGYAGAFMQGKVHPW